MTFRRPRRGITPWKKTALKVCLLWLIMAAGIHLYRIWRSSKFEDQREASRWSSSVSCAQVSAFLPAECALKEENIRELEYKINTALAQDSIKLTATGPDAKLWQDCYSGVGSFTLRAGSKSVDVEAVGTGGAFFMFHPLRLSAGTYYLSDSLMKDEILLDEETAWKLFGSFEVTGRTVQVEDMHLRIAGVYKKEEGRLVDAAGLAEYLVFVQYKTLLQYGGGGSADGTGQDMPATASRPSDQAAPGQLTASAHAPNASSAAAQGASGYAAEQTGMLLASDETIDINLGEGSGGSGDAADGAGAGSGSGSVVSDGAGSASGASDGAGTTGADQESAPGQSGSGDDQSGSGASGSQTQTSEFVGTSNTAYKDTGKITVYEIVMPNPVEGYAASTLETALGEDAGAIVVDNTYRYQERHLLQDLQNFALIGMRREGVRYPYWENAAMGWETIFAALFLLECLLILMTVLLILWMIIHWYRHKTWTIASSIRSLQESMYERQSRKKYPEYYERREQEEDPEQSAQANDAGTSDPAATGTGEENPGDSQTGGETQGPALLEDQGRIPFERIPENRKAVAYETLHQNDQHSDGSSTGAVLDGLRREE